MDAEDGQQRKRGRRKWRLHTYLKRIEPLVGLALFGIALVALRHELAGHGLREIGETLRNLPASRVAAALALAAASYWILTLYDALGVRYAGQRLPYRVVAPASFVSYALSQNLGMAALTGVPVRFRFYSAAGLAPGEIARIFAFVTATFFLGVVALGGVAFVVEPPALPPDWSVPFASARFLGVVLLVLTSAYLVAVAAVRRPIRLGSFELDLPSPRVAVAQILIASADLAASAGVLYVLLPRGAGIGFSKFLAVYLLGLTAGLVSQVPGGLGVFEAVVVATLPVEAPASVILATLLAYRLIYYVLPLAAAGVVLAVSEIRRHGERLAPVMRVARDWSWVMFPHAAAAVVFLAGAVLLFSGATPGLPDRLLHLGRFVPLPLIEVSHLVGSLVGVCLLFLARGLQRRLDGAYVLTIGLLAAGSVTSMVKGLDYEEALILAAIAILLLPMRHAFYRKGALLAERFTGHWFLAIAIVLGATLWLGLLAFRHVEYSHELWWQFALDGDAPRFLRAAVAVSVAAAIFAMLRLLRPSAAQPQPPDATTLDRAGAIVASCPVTASSLALLGDKTFLFDEAGTGFVMYAVEGRSWISMGDPVGPPAVRRDLIWDFRDLVDRYDGWPVFYEVRPENIPLYLDLGLNLLKLGEEAVVPLEEFSLEGASRKALRRARRVAEKAGCRFAVYGPDAVPPLLPELRRVSDQWLASRRTREKGFSLGYFDDAYLRRFPLAVVRREDTTVAFANLWPGADREELSVDLMRYSSEAPQGVMDFLFAELMLWAKGRGYRRFNLGMAPMSGMADHALAPLWSRVGAFVFRHAEDFYNFQGLRAYKDKFGPRWEPRYLASPAGFALPRILANLATLVGGGVRGVFGK